MKFLASFLISLIFTNSFVLAVEYQIDQSKKNLVKFISNAPIEDFEGTTNAIDGYISSENEDLIGAILYFEVDINSVDTGLGLRNRHMRENYMHTSKYPTAVFNGKIMKADKSSSKMDVEVVGKMKIHGVERSVTIRGNMTKNGNSFRIESKFEIVISDYNIEVPKIMFAKIDQNMDLILDFYVKKVK